jgi:hypothetical protein
MTNQNTMDLAIQCKYCNQVYTVEGINPEDYQVWHNGMGLIQYVMSYLSPADRELMISRTCDVCWNKIFNEPTIKMEEPENS